MMEIPPRALSKNLAIVLKPFYRYAGLEFIEDLENDLRALKMSYMADSVQGAKIYLESGKV